MSERETICKACDGNGLLADDENWQYGCTICGGDGRIYTGENTPNPAILSTDENNRVLD